MKISSIFLTFLIAIATVKVSVQQHCQTNGFPGCQCNFLGGCDVSGTPTVFGHEIYGIIPQNIQHFAYVKDSTWNLGLLCEGGTIAILYDCNARIPLFAATVIETGNVERNGINFHRSYDTKLDKTFQAKNSDYKGSSKDILCYEDKETGCFLDWDGTQPCSHKHFSPIHKGHMIAAEYAKADQNMMYNTFSFTNMVPQFEAFNSGGWAQAEKRIKEWSVSCQEGAAESGKSARMFVVVGAIPTTFTGQPRFYGAPGFSNFEGWSRNPKKGEYRIVVPDVMWTAACCALLDNGGTVIGVAAFARKNTPNLGSVIFFPSPQAMVKEFEKSWPMKHSIDLFPKNAKCMTGP